MIDTATQSGFIHFLTQADGPARFVLLMLLLMSIGSWYYILAKSVQDWGQRRRSREFMARFQDMPALAGIVDPDAHDEPFGRMASTAFRAWEKLVGRQQHSAHSSAALLGNPADLLTRTLRRALNEETARLESGLTYLASVASSAPFIGLFGTVWGIYHALLAIGQQGQSSLEQVAGPVGEALIMTALGLSVAIPAVLAYNAIQRGNRVLLAELDGFAHDIYAMLAGGEHLQPVPYTEQRA
ncbi:MAG: MotA/TolQ/ExbB proton channel family protein [Sulfuriferula sp.]|nr:MotA/TolQ/ExbB proton channel family protein [Sulfuriferula sp.]